MQMNLKGAQERAQAVLNAIDRLSANGGLSVNGIGAIQQMAGTVGLLVDIINAEELVPEQKNDSQEITDH